MPIFDCIEEVQYKAPECTCQETGMQKCPVHKVCINCGHQVCPCCGDWCDVILYQSTDKGNHLEPTGFSFVIGGDLEDDYPRMCCDGECVYE